MPTYGIISINDDRLQKKQQIRETLADWHEITLHGVNGNDDAALAKAQIETPIPIRGHAKRGEYGVWFSQLNAWKTIMDYGAPVLVLEDDALLVPDFVNIFNGYIEQLPEDWGLFAAFVPENQYGDFNNEYVCDENGHFVGAAQGHMHGAPSIVLPDKTICRAYQGYGCVGNYISPLGAAALYEYALDRGLDTPVDCFVFEAYRAKKLDAYAFRPGFPRLIDVDWNAPTTIHTSERIDLSG